VQLLFGLIVGLGGYGTLLFNGITGCDASELYLYYFGGVLLLFLDLHEYVRSWPLRTPILGHHVMVFFFGLAMIEYDLIPPPDVPDPRISVATMLLVANIGLMWITDFFHVIFRLSTSLPLIERYRKIYLITSIVRPITLALMIYGAVELIIVGSIAGAIPCITLSVAYAYNLVKAIQFVYTFDCEKYFNSHQAKWVEESSGEDINSKDVQIKTFPIKYDLSKSPDEVSLDHIEDGEIFANNRASLTSSQGSRRRSSLLFKRGRVVNIANASEDRRSSVLNTLFAIQLEDNSTNLMEGLRGDVAIDHELEDSSPEV